MLALAREVTERSLLPCALHPVLHTNLTSAEALGCTSFSETVAIPLTAVDQSSKHQCLGDLRLCLDGARLSSDVEGLV
jgi:hypothetical protein